MKSNYDLLGNHIRLIDNRNKDLVTEQVLGINIDKFFMPSVANVIGTDLSKYKLIQKGNFACNPMHVGRDERLPVALYSEDTPAIVSPAYFMFEIKDTTVLNADFLMMWFRRPEFDRICWLHTDGSVRGGITWEDICRMEIPVPPIDEQIEIVSSYQAITERIKLKKRINDNLEATAMAIFKAYFVTFERYGGNMPTTWEKATIGDVVSVIRGASPRPIQDYMSQTGMPWVKISDASSSVSKYLFRTAECIIPEGVSSSRTVTEGMMIVSNSASPGLPMIMKITACVHDGWLIIDNYKRVTQEYMYYHFLSERQSLVSSSNGSVFNNLKTDIVKAHPVIIPDEETMKTITQQFCKFNRIIERNAKEINSLIDLQGNLLSQLASC
jgi:type I restriction enzyme S subunit